MARTTAYDERVSALEDLRRRIDERSKAFASEGRFASGASALLELRDKADRLRSAWDGGGGAGDPVRENELERELDVLAKSFERLDDAFMRSEEGDAATDRSSR